MKLSMVNIATTVAMFKRVGLAIEEVGRKISHGLQLLAIRAGFRHPVSSMQVVLDYPKPGPRRSRFTGIAAMRRKARKERNRRAAA